jgi:RNA recognition motif-containing protein
MQLADKIVYVGPFLKRVERVGEGREERYTNVYIKNLAEDVDDEGLRKICAEHGPVTSAVVMVVSRLCVCVCVCVCLFMCFGTGVMKRGWRQGSSGVLDRDSR